MLVERSAPCCTCIREENIDMIRVLLDFIHQRDDSLDFRDVRGNGHGFGVGAFIWEGIQCFNGGFASGGFAGGDYDERAAVLEKAISIGVNSS